MLTAVKASFAAVYNNFTALCYIAIPYMILTTLITIISGGYETLIPTVRENSLEENAAIISKLFPFLLLQFFYSAKALRASMRLFCDGPYSVSEYNLLRWNKAELSFVLTTLLYTVVAGAVCLALSFGIPAMFTFIAFLPAVIFPSSATALLIASIAPAVSIGIAVILCVIFCLRAVFIFPAKAMGQPLKISSSIKFSKGSMRTLLATLALAFIPFAVVIILAGMIPPSLAVYTKLLVGFLWGMVCVAIICNHYNKLMDELMSRYY